MRLLPWGVGHGQVNASFGFPTTEPRTNISNDPRNVYSWVEILPGKEKVSIADGRAMRLIGVGSLPLKMDSRSDMNVKLRQGACHIRYRLQTIFTA